MCIQKQKRQRGCFFPKLRQYNRIENAEYWGLVKLSTSFQCLRDWKLKPIEYMHVFEQAFS